MSDEELAPPSPAGAGPSPLRGGLSEGWRSVMMITWLLVLGAMAAVAVSSRTIGRSVWWLGPSVDPAPIVAVLVPIVLCTVPLVAVFRRASRTGVIGVVSGLLLAVTTLPDLADRPAGAFMVLVISIGAVLSSGAVALATRN